MVRIKYRIEINVNRLKNRSKIQEKNLNMRIRIWTIGLNRLFTSSGAATTFKDIQIKPIKNEITDLSS